MKNKTAEPKLVIKLSVVLLFIALVVVNNSTCTRTIKLLVLAANYYRLKELEMKSINKVFTLSIEGIDYYNQMLEKFVNLLAFGRFEITSSK